MRRIAAWAAAALMGTVVLVGCSDGEAEPAAEEPATPASTATEQTSSPAATPEPTADSTVSTEPSDDPTFDPSGSYCDVLGSMQQSFGSFDPQRFDETVDQFRTIAAAAPAEVADEWDLLVGVLSGLDEALADLGLSYADLADPETMAEIDTQDAERIAKLAQRLSVGSDEAMVTIQQHALSECDVDLAQ